MLTFNQHVKEDAHHDYYKKRDEMETFRLNHLHAYHPDHQRSPIRNFARRFVERHVEKHGFPKEIEAPEWSPYHKK